MNHATGRFDPDARRLVLELPTPSPALSPNSRTHWARRLKHKQRAAHDATILALEALDGRDGPRWASARVDVLWRVRDRRGLARDRDNVLASLKASLDALQHAGVVANDRGLRFGDVEIVVANDEGPGVRLTITGDS